MTGYDKSKEGVQHVFDPKAEKKSKVQDRDSMDHMKAKDDLHQDKQQVQDTNPH